MQITDAALRLITARHDLENLRLQARLYAFGAENSAALGFVDDVHIRLSASEALLEHFSTPHEEFDRVSWLQYAGTCALNLKQYAIAAPQLECALDDLPVQWSLRFISTALPLAKALTYTRQRDEAIAVARKTLQTITSVQARVLTQKFVNYIQEDLLNIFVKDKVCREFVVEAQQQLSLPNFA